eukprot:1161024-Pelagomonas_calceolata.AAC.15
MDGLNSECFNALCTNRKLSLCARHNSGTLRLSMQHGQGRFSCSCNKDSRMQALGVLAFTMLFPVGIEYADSVTLPSSIKAKELC